MSTLNLNLNSSSCPVNMPIKHQASIRYVENKKLDHGSIDRYLSISAAANQWTNFGPLSKMLEARISELLDLGPDLRVVACSNATSALHALVIMQRSFYQHSLKWASCAFGFYSSVDGVLAKADILDCDQRAMLDLSQLGDNQFDGIIATNIFGQMPNMDDYKHHAEKNQQVLVIDSAMGFQKGGHIANECISLHHTKPWGFGECGCAIVHKDHEQRFRSIISFGHDKNSDPINRFAMNGKISDVACAYVLMWLDQYDALIADYNEQYARISDIALRSGFSILGEQLSHPGIPSNVPLLLPKANLALPEINIPFGRYYHPLSSEQVMANTIYQRIINIPCHRDMAKLSDDTIRRALDALISA